MIIIDSNIWAYYFDESAPEHGYVIEAVENALKTEEIVINTVIIMELAHFLIKNLGIDVGRRKLRVFLGFPFTIVDLTHELVLIAIRLLVRYAHLGIGGRNATILATMRKLGIDTIMTHDTAFKRIPDIKVVDPIPSPLGQAL